MDILLPNPIVLTRLPEDYGALEADGSVFPSRFSAARITSATLSGCNPFQQVRSQYYDLSNMSLPHL